jgi:hypothetical protein
MIAIYVTALALIAANASPTPIVVTVVAPRDVSKSLVSQICAEAGAIWAPAGIALEWNRNAPTHEARGLTIEVTIDDRPTPARRDGALGWVVFKGDGPEHLIHLSRVSAEDLLHRTPGLTDATIASHEALIGRALGRALAHELGHYILRSKVHTGSGLMRAAWTSDQAFRFIRDGFELTPEERATAVNQLRAELACGASAPGVASC